MPIPTPLSVQLYSVRDALAADRPAALARLADAGFVVVEPFGVGEGDTPVESAAALRRDLDAAGLIARWTHSRAPLDDHSDLVLDAAGELGVDTIVVPWPLAVAGATAEFGDVDAMVLLGERLAEAAGNAATRGLKLAYHNHSQEFTLLPEGRTAYDVIVETAGPDVGLEADIYWMQTGGVDPATVIGRYADRVFSLHVKDGPATLNDDQTVAGTGTVDLTAALQAATSAQWHTMEIDRCAGDVFEVLADSASWAVDAGLSTWTVDR